ncbi:Bidirectional sugar transporter SWEET7b [Phytophthora cinnamomi]|uniref:Bidirectional sugar transporter SWEET7b n=1 Tax=Phytophthora cinnamomi TaxID=4785 RepID=UPI00355A2CD2|nr:Bidirectional sugar transporter SWEET7b [Phytophthora cinnamomi]
MASDAAETTINVLATIATACIFLSMLPGMYIVHKKRKTTGVNFYPLAMMFGQSMGWVIYSLADHAFFPVGAVNCLGAVLGVIFSAVFILHEKERRVRYSIFFCGVFALIIALLLYRFLGTQDDDTIAKVLGYFADVMAIIMFGSPLMLMGDVIKTKNSEIIAAPMAVSGFVNGALWTTYGIMQTDYYVLVPNAISGLLCLVQVILVVIFPRSRSGEKKGELSEKLSVDNEA